jgi:hypothetical protein
MHVSTRLLTKRRVTRSAGMFNYISWSLYVALVQCDLWMFGAPAALHRALLELSKVKPGDTDA